MKNTNWLVCIRREAMPVNGLVDNVPPVGAAPRPAHGEGAADAASMSIQAASKTWPSGSAKARV